MVKRKPGRPTVFTPDLCQKMLGHFADGASVEEACDLVGISHSAFFKAQADTDPDENPHADPRLVEFFHKAVPRARRALPTVARQIVADSLKDDVPIEVRRAMAVKVLALERQREALSLKAKELRDGSKVHLTGSIGISEDRRAYLEALRQDPEAVKHINALASRMQPDRLKKMGLKPTMRGSAPLRPSGGASPG